MMIRIREVFAEDERRAPRSATFFHRIGGSVTPALIYVLARRFLQVRGPAPEREFRRFKQWNCISTSISLHQFRHQRYLSYFSSPSFQTVMLSAPLAASLVFDPGALPEMKTKYRYAFDACIYIRIAPGTGRLSKIGNLFIFFFFFLYLPGRKFNA